MRHDELHIPESPLALGWTVNDVLLRYPATAAVFNAFGVDTCCGGAQSVDAACVGAGLDPETVLASLRAVTGDDA